jgi:hypothetical protein
MSDNKAHTLTELLIASTIVIILFASCVGAFILTKTICYTSIAEYNLQRDVNTIMARIVKGVKEQADVFGLRSAKSYSIPAASRLDFVGTDGNTRSYLADGNAIIYISPVQSPQQNTIYVVPSDSSMILRFWNPYAGQPNNDNATVGIYLSVSQRIGDRIVSGSSSTYVNLRNIPK